MPLEGGRPPPSGSPSPLPARGPPASPPPPRSGGGGPEGVARGFFSGKGPRGWVLFWGGALSLLLSLRDPLGGVRGFNGVGSLAIYDGKKKGVSWCNP